MIRYLTLDLIITMETS